MLYKCWLRYILPDLIGIDASIKERESLAGRGAWSAKPSLLRFTENLAAPFWCSASLRNRIQRSRDWTTTGELILTMFVVEDRSRRHFREAAVMTRKDLLLEPSQLDRIYDKQTGRFLW